MQLTVIESILSFTVFVFLQAFFINGVHECCRGGCTNDYAKGRICTGQVIYKLNPEWFERNKHRDLAKPFFSCVKCMASVWGAITFWPTVIFFYGGSWIEIPVFVFDVFILVTVNWLVYKKL